MDDERGLAPLRMDLRKGRDPWRIPRVRWPVMILVGVVLLAVRVGLGWLSPEAGLAFELGLRWLVAAGWMLGVALIWRQGDVPRTSPQWLVLVALGTAWFVGRAGYETYIALT